MRSLDDASGIQKLDTHPLDVTFLEYLTLPRLYQVTAIPGDPDPDHLIEILRAPTPSGWRDSFAAAYAYVFPRRSFVVSATLRTRDHPYHRFGVSVQVRKLPGSAIELESQWSSNFDRALQRAAYAVGAYILPHTRKCRNVPWSHWRGTTLPVSLFRDYQRAKKMVNERRFDESLDLFHRALRQDATNIGFRYDIGQLYERFGLFPDALFNYLRIVNEIFPVRSRRRMLRWRHRQDDLHRAARPRWWPEAARDPFVIRYRYVIVLGLGSALAAELCFPEWKQLRDWMLSPRGYDSGDESLENRPWRAVEVTDLRRLLAEQLSVLFPSLGGEGTGSPGEALLEKIRRCQEAPKKKRAGPLRDVERYLLDCAAAEVAGLERSFRSINWTRLRGRLSHGSSASLTTISISQASLFIKYRRGRLDRMPKISGADRDGWPSLADINDDLKQVNYDQYSSNWLEHYNAACLYALPLLNDKRQVASHEEYARKSVEALERALECGENVDFVKAKRYWLQAGDPDLVGLRRYDCFRAFEARVYGRPLPAAPDLAKYELYLPLRAVLEYGSQHLEQEWRRRASLTEKQVTAPEFEEWWRQEEHAWKVAVRLGRFYRQWQTRNSVVENLRNWIESFGGDAWPVPYFNLIRADIVADTTNYARVARLLASTEDIFKFLGRKCGHLSEDSDDGNQTVMRITHAWTKYAWDHSESGLSTPLMSREVREACLSAPLYGRHCAIGRNFLERTASAHSANPSVTLPPRPLDRLSELFKRHQSRTAKLAANSRVQRAQLARQRWSSNRKRSPGTGAHGRQRQTPSPLHTCLGRRRSQDASLSSGHTFRTGRSEQDFAIHTTEPMTVPIRRSAWAEWHLSLRAGGR